MTTSPFYQKTVLPNGLRVVTEKIPGVRSASLGIWVSVGSRHETPAENGISHFIEHMAFKGTETRSALDIARTVEQGGGYINAFTSKELTCFHVHVLDERLPSALDILADILRDSVCDPAEMEKEKQVILDEIRDHEDMPDDVAHERFVKALFNPHPLAQPILGPPENIRGFSRDDVLKFVSQHYLPDRMVVAAAGHVNHAAIVKRVAQALDLSGKSKIRRDPASTNHHNHIERISRPIQQAHMVIGTSGLPYNHPDRLTLSIMNTILGGGMSSRLFQNIREKHGIAYSIYCFTEMFADSGLWGVYLATDPERVERAREMVIAELKDLASKPLPKEEIDGVKTGLKGNIMLGLESVSSRMMRLGRMEVYLGRYQTLQDVSQQIDAVTPKRVYDLVNRLIDEDNLITTIVQPEQTKKTKSKAKAKPKAAVLPKVKVAAVKVAALAGKNGDSNGKNGKKK
ncbi:MAG TPA: pitrilysin family protein [bacterium]